MKNVLFYVLSVANFIAGIYAGSFALSNILLPITVSLPFVRFLEKENLLIKPIPRSPFVLAPLTWSLLAVGAFSLYHAFFPDYLGAFSVGFASSIFLVVKRAFQGIHHPDVRADLMSYYQSYIRPDAITPRLQPQDEGERNAGE